jgi:hypothetical protein
MQPNSTIVTRPPWNFGTESGSGIRGHLLQPFRLREGKLFKDGKHRVQKGQLWGLAVRDSQVADTLALLYGYVQKYSRNSTHFVQSRAARRRGYVTSDVWYLRRVERSRLAGKGVARGK